MRFALAALLVIHGLIHLIGLRLSGSKVVGFLWLGTAVLLVSAAALRLFEKESWWIPAALGITASQVLIIQQWSDAKAGTMANVLLVLPVVIGFATMRFHRANEDHARALLARAPAGEPANLTEADVASLPPPVKRWLDASGAIGKPRARTVRLLQRGEMRTSPTGPFMHAEAKQYFTVDEPGFVWTVDVTMFGVVPVVGRDSYVDGRARMFIQAGGLVTVADGTGEKFDQGTLLRFLGEIIWFPSAAIAPYIAWEPIDDAKAKATISHHGTSASAVFEFDERGRLTTMSAKRYLNGETLEDWTIPITEWKAIRGIEMPTRGSAVWKLAPEKGGDFEYYRWEILDVEPNYQGTVSTLSTFGAARG